MRTWGRLQLQVELQVQALWRRRNSVAQNGVHEDSTTNRSVRRSSSCRRPRSALPQADRKPKKATCGKTSTWISIKCQEARRNETGLRAAENSRTNEGSSRNLITRNVQTHRSKVDRRRQGGGNPADSTNHHGDNKRRSLEKKLGKRRRTTPEWSSQS